MVWISGQVRRVTKSIRREMRRRAAVEPVTGHLKDTAPLSLAMPFASELMRLCLESSIQGSSSISALFRDHRVEAANERVGIGQHRNALFDSGNGATTVGPRM
ncbi:hypothetical protein ACVWXN_007031 [Bradyrhizobium sp. i1.4.4]